MQSISTSQLSRKFRDTDATFLDGVFKDVVMKLFHHFGQKKAPGKMGRLHLIDSSTITLCLTKYRWAEFRKTKAGIKLHLRFIHQKDGSYPDEAILKPAKPADKSQMDDLVVEEENALNIFDRAYVDYRKFDIYCNHSVRFVTRLKSNVAIEVIKENPVDPSSNILRDVEMKLGDEKTYKMEHSLRLIECLDSQGNLIMIITNDFELSAEEIGDLYRHRWQIEIFFKWIKQHLYIKKCYGTRQNAVYNQIRIALITYCLTLLLQKNTHHEGSLLTVLKYLRHHWEESFTVFLKALFRPPSRHSKGRRRMKHDLVFEETLWQFDHDDREMIEHLDDLTIDPLI